MTNKQSEIVIFRGEKIIFNLYVEDEEQAKLFCKYFNNNISNMDVAFIKRWLLCQYIRISTLKSGVTTL